MGKNNGAEKKAKAREFNRRNGGEDMMVIVFDPPINSDDVRKKANNNWRCLEAKAGKVIKLKCVRSVGTKLLNLRGARDVTPAAK